MLASNSVMMKLMPVMEMQILLVTVLMMEILL